MRGNPVYLMNLSFGWMDTSGLRLTVCRSHRALLGNSGLSNMAAIIECRYCPHLFHLVTTVVTIYINKSKPLTKFSAK